MSRMDIKRGEIYWAMLRNHGTEHKQVGLRPVIVIQADELNNSNLLTTLVIPTSTQEISDTRNSVVLQHTVMPEKSAVLCDNLQIVDKYKLKRHNKIGQVDILDMIEIEKKLISTLGVNLNGVL